MSDNIFSVAKEVVRAETSSDAGRVNMLFMLLTTIMTLAVCIASPIEVIANAFLTFFGKSKLEVFPSWLIPTLVVCTILSFPLCLWIVTRTFGKPKSSNNKNPTTV